MGLKSKHLALSCNQRQHLGERCRWTQGEDEFGGIVLHNAGECGKRDHLGFARRTKIPLGAAASQFQLDPLRARIGDDLRQIRPVSWLQHQKRGRSGNGSAP